MRKSGEADVSMWLVMLVMGQWHISLIRGVEHGSANSTLLHLAGHYRVQLILTTTPTDCLLLSDWQH